MDTVAWPKYFGGFMLGGVVGLIGYALAAPQALAPLGQHQEERPVRVLFVGDLMLDRTVARTALALGPDALFASSTRALFADADLRVGNLEGTVTDNQSIAQQNNKILRFTFEPTLAARVLASLAFDAVSLANNHALDFYESGYLQTAHRLDELGVRHFGHPLNASSTLSTIIGSGDKTVCIVGYHSLFSPATTTVVAEILRIRPDCWRIAVFAHWGDEYEPLANAAQVAAARAFVDAGADVVIGAHPHVVQNVEAYRGKAIFYSLGNFMFDQNFSWETQHGLAVRVDFYASTTAFVLTPLEIVDQRSAVATGADKARVLEAAGSLAEFILP